MPELAARQAAFARLVDLTLPAVLAFAVRRCPNAALAERVTEAALARAWIDLDEAPADPTLWVLGLARESLAEHLSVADQRAWLLELLADGDPTLRAELQELSAIELEAVLLVEWDGVRSTDLATVAGCSRSAARVRLHRGRGKLDEALGRTEASEGAAVSDAGRVEDAR